MEIQRNCRVLFQGDSVTDCGRGREDDSNLGTGYAMMAAALFHTMYPELGVTFQNRGISGNRTIDLKNRWQEDCIDLKPDIVSILIGINDCWRRFDNNDPTTPEQYKANYRYILNETREKLNAKIVLCEPFLLPVTEEQKRHWREDLDPKIQIARELAREFNAVYIPFDGMFAAKAVMASPDFWAADGVHPTPAGHMLMAKAWVESLVEMK